MGDSNNDAPRVRAVALLLTDGTMRVLDLGARSEDSQAPASPFARSLRFDALEHAGVIEVLEAA